MPQPDSSTSATRRPAFRAYLELVRLPNVFTAMADVAMGFLFVQEIRSALDVCQLAFLLTASSLLYMGGMALNDVCDRKRDAVERPERPLPSGRISYRVAVRLSGGLLIAGTLIGWLTPLLRPSFLPLLVTTLLAAGIVAYDALLKNTVLGPPLMGACRMLNVLLGMSVVHGGYRPEHWLVAGAIGVYITGVTCFAQREAGRSPRLFLTLATAIMLGGIALLALLPEWSDRLIDRLQNDPGRWRFLMLLLGAIIGYRCLRAIAQPDARRVRAAVVVAILSLVILDAAVCFAVRGPWWAAGIIALLLPAMVLSLWISPT
ncbi:MAG: UbiA family prenyltransferase [Pirellulales bacterium]|nr:UbiA family prenyltransferase [Pirellulales bacterium]